MRGHGDDLGVDEIDGPDRVFGATDHGDVVDRRSPHRVALQIGRAHRDGQQALGAVRGERLDQGLGRVGSADDDGALHELAVGAVAPQPSTQHESSDERARDEDPDDGEQVGARGPHAPDVGHDGHDSDEHESGASHGAQLLTADRQATAPVGVRERQREDPHDDDEGNDECIRESLGRAPLDRQPGEPRQDAGEHVDRKEPLQVAGVPGPVPRRSPRGASLVDRRQGAGVPA